MIIALSGKMGCGKTTLADELLQIRPGHRISFADALREEVAALLNVYLRDVYTQEFKSEEFQIGNRRMTGREILQWWGTEIRRASDKDYWSRKMAERCQLMPGCFLVVDDMRFMSELEVMRDLHAICIRINPHENWTPGPSANHASETDLDEYTLWDMVVSLGYGKIRECAGRIMSYKDATG